MDDSRAAPQDGDWRTGKDGREFFYYEGQWWPVCDHVTTSCTLCRDDWPEPSTAGVGEENAPAHWQFRDPLAARLKSADGISAQGEAAPAYLGEELVAI
jgi:hypothetical protein